MLTHKGTEKIQSERLILRKFEIEDTPEVYQNLSSKDEVFRFLQHSPNKDISQTRKYVECIISRYKQLDYYKWVIIDKEKNVVVGEISVCQIDPKNQFTCEVGYNISPDFWGFGYATEALGMVVDFLFKDVGFNRIEALHDLENLASEKVIIKNSFTCEGILKESDYRQGKFYDLKVYSITKSQFLNTKSETQHL